MLNKQEITRTKMPIKNKDFIELEYTGREKESGQLFDTTDKAIAKKEGVFNPKMDYGPVTICIGENHILKAIDEYLEEKDIGNHKLELEPEQAFGLKSPKLIQLIPTARFRKEGISPELGMQINIDSMPAVIKNVSGGRTLVDMNHPLSGKDVIYEINVKKIVSDDSEKFRALILNRLGIKEIDTTLNDGKATVTIKYELPTEIQELLKKNTKELIPSIKDITFIKKDEKTETKTQKKE